VKKFLAVVCACVLTAWGVETPHAAVATVSKIERQTLERIPLPNTDEELQMMLVTFPPGAESEPHMHPVEGMNYIVEGMAESQYEGHPLERYKAGDSYLDLASVTHKVFRNPSKTHPLKFVIAFKIKKGVAFKQDLPAPTL